MIKRPTFDEFLGMRNVLEDLECDLNEALRKLAKEEKEEGKHIVFYKFLVIQEYLNILEFMIQNKYFVQRVHDHKDRLKLCMKEMFKLLPSKG